MTSDPRPPRRPARRRYPAQSYIPFTLMVAVPLLIIALIITMVAHAVAPAAHPLAAPGTPPVQQSAISSTVTTARATVPAAGATTPTAGVAQPAHPVTAGVAQPAHPVTAGVTQPTHPVTAGAAAGLPRTSIAAIATGAPSPHAAPAATATVTPALPVTIALDSTSSGLPVGAAAVFHGAHTRLWAFASIPNVRAGDTMHFVWRDLDRRATVADWPQPIQIDAARYAARMYAFPGSNPSPSTPFPSGHYRVDVYHNGLLVASTRFTVVAS